MSLDKLKRLIDDVTSQTGWSQKQRDELVPEEQRGILARNCWTDGKFIYGMEYGLIAAYNLLIAAGGDNGVD